MIYEFDKYKISEQTLNELYLKLAEIFNWEIVIQNENKNLLNPIPFSLNYGKYLGELFIQNQNNILTNVRTSGMIKVSYGQFVDFVKKNKLANKDGLVADVDGLIGLWKE